MSKRVKVLISVVVAVALLAVGGATVVMAQEKSVSPPEAVAKASLAAVTQSQIEPLGCPGYISDNRSDALLNRVAEILGIPKENLVSAFKQAQKEMREEAFTQALDKAVEKGRITQEQANEIKKWWQERPEAKGPGLFPGAFGAPGLGDGHMKGWRGGAYGGLAERMAL